jgi:hypothetical protein
MPSAAKTTCSGTLHGVRLPFPHATLLSLALDIEQVQPCVLELIRKHHHPRVPVLECVQFWIESPRGKHSGIAFIEVQYRVPDKPGWWRQTFSVAYSASNGLTLWTGVRRYAAR